MEHYSFSIKGARQGQFKGELRNLKGRDDWMAGFRFSMQLSVPRDATTGQASGRRRHQPVSISKEWGLASPQILQALATAEVLNPVVLEFSRANPSGEELVFRRITLTNAVISDVRRYLDFTAPPAGSTSRELEDILFTYQKITVEDAIGNTSFTDDSSGPA
jgi:type VI secretion system secreted protein Hcp